MKQGRAKNSSYGIFLLSQIIKIAKRGRCVALAFALALLTTVSDGNRSASAYNFQGYYCPTVLISPMRDDVVYTPVGLGIVTSKAGFRVHPVTGKGDFHSGVDLGASLNDKVYNLLDGIVTRVGWRGNLGVAVEIYHPYPNVRTICGHLNAYAVMPGQYVTRGRVIGYAGSTGRSTGVHVHYTVIKQETNEYIEPMSFLSEVPLYVGQLHNARVQAEMVMNTRRMKEKALANNSTDGEGDALPEKTQETKAPEVKEFK